MRALLLAFLVLACNDPAADACADAAALEPGAIEATRDGEAWSAADASWMVASPNVQLTDADSGGGFLSVVLQWTADETTAEEALAAGVFPIEFTVASGAGAFATYYPPAGTSFTTNQAAGGTLTLAALEDDVLTGCFAFEAAGDGGTTTFEAGAFRASPSDLR